MTLFGLFLVYPILLTNMYNFVYITLFIKQLKPIITMATNEEMLVSAFQEKVAIRSSFILANMFSYVSQ